MRKRTYRARVWLDDKEYKAYRTAVKQSGLTQETFLRQLITGYIPCPAPPLDYHKMIQELNAIGNNLNQIAAVANSKGYINIEEYRQAISALRNSLTNIQKAVELPERR